MDPILRDEFHRASFDLLLSQLLHAGDRSSWERETASLEAWVEVARHYADALAHDRNRHGHLAIVPTAPGTAGVRVTVRDERQVDQEVELPSLCPLCQADFSDGTSLRGYSAVTLTLVDATSHVGIWSQPGPPEEVRCRRCEYRLF